MNLWQKVTKDLQKEFRAGVAFIKGSTSAMKKQVRKLTEAEKRHLDIVDLKTKIHAQMAGLGGKVYELASKHKNPMQDKSVKAYLGRIEKLEIRITKLEKQPAKSTKKTTKKRTPKKSAQRK